MIDLRNMIEESLLDDELEDTVDKIVDEHKIEKLLSDQETFLKGYQELIANFGGTKKSIPVSQMSQREHYIVFRQDTLYDEYRWAIYIIVPTGIFRFVVLKILFSKKFYNLIEGEDNCDLIFRDASNRDYYNSLYSVEVLNRKSKYNNFDHRYIYKLPESYKFLINFIKKKAKEK